MAIDRDIYKRGRLTARPNKNPLKEMPTEGVQPLKLSDQKDGLIYVPKSYNKNRPASIAVMLHGAGAKPDQGLSLLKFADDKNIIIIAPASRASTWDIMANGSFNTDVIFIDQALTLAFNKFAIDPLQVAIGGFSDGASYALCIGLSNGDLFTNIIAFSPGFVHTIEMKGKPAIFISHGVKDHILPVDRCSRRITPQLQRQGYQVDYREFQGAHEIPAGISKSSVEWFIENNRRSH